MNSASKTSERYKTDSTELSWPLVSCPRKIRLLRLQKTPLHLPFALVVPHSPTRRQHRSPVPAKPYIRGPDASSASCSCRPSRVEPRISSPRLPRASKEQTPPRHDPRQWTGCEVNTVLRDCLRTRLVWGVFFSTGRRSKEKFHSHQASTRRKRVRVQTA